MNHVNINFSANSINLPAIDETVSVLMQHALSVNPSQPSWLRTQADVHFGMFHIMKIEFYMVISDL